jgi:hypothetical protein
MGPLTSLFKIPYLQGNNNGRLQHEPKCFQGMYHYLSIGLGRPSMNLQRHLNGFLRSLAAVICLLPVGHVTHCSKQTGAFLTLMICERAEGKPIPTTDFS